MSVKPTSKVGLQPSVSTASALALPGSTWWICSALALHYVVTLRNTSSYALS